MDLLSFASSFIKDFILILSEMSPYLLLGFLFAGLLHSFIPRNKIEKYFNQKPLRSSFLASIFGIPLPLCSCGVIPTGAAFYKNGASKSGTVSFLISTPQTGVDSILATFSLMGLPFAIIRPIAALITGISGGLLTAVVTKEQFVSTLIEEEIESKTILQKFLDALKYGFVDFIQDISKWLVIGLGLAALISASIPDDFFTLVNLSPLLQMIIILVISIPLYICATGSIPLAAILILKGISPGAAFVLLMAGPATNAATITMIGKVLGRKSLFTYLLTIIIGAIGFGLLIDYVFPTSWFTDIANQHLNHSHGGHLSWWQISSGVILLGLITFGYIKKHMGLKNNHSINLNNNHMEIKTIKVEGMTCNHCKANVEKGLTKLTFVDSAEVDLANKTVTLKGEKVNEHAAKELIDELGYTCVS